VVSSAYATPPSSFKRSRANVAVVETNGQVAACPGTAVSLLLVDLARHVAAAYVKDGHDAEVVLAGIRQAFEAEWDNPTDSPIDLSS
jgi:hypothetical protein